MINDFLADNNRRAYPFVDIPTAGGVDIRDLLVAAHAVTKVTGTSAVVTSVSSTQLLLSVAGEALDIPITPGTAVVVTGAACTVSLTFGTFDGQASLPSPTAVVNGTLLQTLVTVVGAGVTSISLATELDPTFSEVGGVFVMDPRYQYAVTARNITGPVRVTPGNNAAINSYADTGILEFNALAGAGEGYPAERPELPDVDEFGGITLIDQESLRQKCSTGIQAINGVSPATGGDLGFTGSTGVTVTPNPAVNTVYVQFTRAAGPYMIWWGGV